MQYSLDMYLVLGCAGNKMDELVICSPCENILLDLHNIDQKLLDFLDLTCNLFIRPVGDWNQVINTIKILHNNYGIFTNSRWDAVQVWIMQHKKCGAYLRLCQKSDFINIQNSSEEQLILPNNKRFEESNG